MVNMTICTNCIYLLLPIFAHHYLKYTKILNHGIYPIKGIIQILTFMQMLYILFITKISYTTIVVCCIHMNALYHIFGKNNKVNHTQIQTMVGFLHSMAIIWTVIVIIMGFSYNQIIQEIIGFSHVYYLYDSMLLSDCGPSTYNNNSLIMIMHHYLNPLISENAISAYAHTSNHIYLIVFVLTELFNVVYDYIVFDGGSVLDKINIDHIIYAGLLYLICLFDFSIILKISLIFSLAYTTHVRSKKISICQPKKDK